MATRSTCAVCGNPIYLGKKGWIHIGYVKTIHKAEPIPQLKKENPQEAVKKGALQANDLT